MRVIVSLYCLLLFEFNIQNDTKTKEIINYISHFKINPYSYKCFVLIPKVICKGCIDKIIFDLENSCFKNSYCILTSNFDVFIKYKNSTFVVFDKSNIMNNLSFRPFIATLIFNKKKNFEIISIKNTKEEINLLNFCDSKNQH